MRFQIKALVTQLEESARQMNDAVGACKTAIEINDPNAVSTYTLKLEPDFLGAKKALEDRPVIIYLLLFWNKQDTTNACSLNLFQAPDPFNDKGNVFDANASNEFKSDTFATAFDNKLQGSGFDGGFDDSFLSCFAPKPTEAVVSSHSDFSSFGVSKPASMPVSPFVSTMVRNLTSHLSNE